MNYFKKNIEYIIKSRNLQKKDIESEMGVSTGYLSRMTFNSISLKTAYNLSVILGFNLNTLINIDLDKAEEKKRVIQQIEDLKSKLKELENEVEND